MSLVSKEKLGHLDHVCHILDFSTLLGGGILQACKNNSTSVHFIMYIKDCDVRSEEKGIVWNLDTNIELFT